MPKATAAAPPLPSTDKVKEVQDKLTTKKSDRIASAEEGRRSSTELRVDWAKALKKSRKGTGKGKGKGKENKEKGKGKGKSKGKGRYQVKKEDGEVRAEAISKLEKSLDKKRRSSLKMIEKTEEELKLKKPSFSKVKDLVPDGKNVNLLLKFQKMVTGGEDGKFVEAVVGDDTGIVTISLQNKEKASCLDDGASLRVQNAKVVMVKGFMRVAIDKWAVIKANDEPLTFEVKSSNDMSSTEYELVEQG